MNLKKILGASSAAALVMGGSLGMYATHFDIDRIILEHRARSPIVHKYYLYSERISEEFTFKRKEKVRDEQTKFRASNIRYFEALDRDKKKQESYLTFYGVLFFVGAVLGASVLLPAEKNNSR